MTPVETVLGTLAIALIYDISINLVHLAIMSPDEYNRKREVAATWNREMRKALLRKDTKKIAELKKRERVKDEAEAALAVASLKVMIVSFALIWAIFFLVLPMFSAASVALPFEFPFIGDRLNYVLWFIFATLAFSFPIRRAFGFI